MALLKPCWVDDCGELSDQARCPTHRPTRNKALNIRDTARWQRLRKRVIAMTGHCEWCGTTTDLTADHVIPISERPDLAFEPLNVRCLCDLDNSRRGNKCTEYERNSVLAAFEVKRKRQQRTEHPFVSNLNQP